MLESDQKFARRHVPIASLLPVWAAASAQTQQILNPAEVVNLVIKTMLQTAGRTTALHPRTAHLFGPEGDFMSDSVEHRVVAFQRLANEIASGAGERNLSELEQAVLAAGAFLVGRGSSHSFLLTRLPRRWALSFTWFGLMSGLSGPHTWDGEWSRAAKGLERSLRGQLDWYSASGADLSWPEYLWLTATFTGKQIFADLPKMLPKVLSIEILPGVGCQLRLVTDGARDLGQREKLETESRERELQETLDQVATLAMRARRLLLGHESQRAPGQGSLAIESTEERESNAMRSRRGKRN